MAKTILPPLCGTRNRRNRFMTPLCNISMDAVLSRTAAKFGRVKGNSDNVSSRFDAGDSHPASNFGGEGIFIHRRHVSSSSCRRIGLETKSLHPAESEAACSSDITAALQAIKGNFQPRSRMAFASSAPFISGIIMSVTMRSNGTSFSRKAFSTISKACRPFSALITSAPARESSSFNKLLWSGMSSTTRIRPWSNRASVANFEFAFGDTAG